MWKWRDKVHHYRGLAVRKQSPRVHDLLLSLAKEVEPKADAMVVRRDEDPAEFWVPNRSMRLPTRIDMAATPLRDASRSVRWRKGHLWGRYLPYTAKLARASLLSFPPRPKCRSRDAPRSSRSDLGGLKPKASFVRLPKSGFSSVREPCSALAAPVCAGFTGLSPGRPGFFILRVEPLEGGAI